MCGRRWDCKLLFMPNRKAEKGVIFPLALALGRLKEQEQELEKNGTIEE